MPRTARIDMPGLLQHVIVRGIEKKDIFLDYVDRASFLTRFSDLLLQCHTDCLAWAMLPNHAHMLLRSRHEKLARFMRRLLTGHATTFNLRHARVGHLFQNRYKSIVCEEEPYLLELIGYIHLNPLRAGIVEDLNELERYPWCGHSVLMGKQELPGQKIDEVFSRFGRRRSESRRGYRAFVLDGIALGRRKELGAGGRGSFPSADRASTAEHFDERVLGSEGFVEGLHQDEDFPVKPSARMPLAELTSRVAEAFGVTQEALEQRERTQPLADARAVLCYLAVRKMNHNGEEVARILKMTRSGVSASAYRGEALVMQNEKILELAKS